MKSRGGGGNLLTLLTKGNSRPSIISPSPSEVWENRDMDLTWEEGGEPTSFQRSLKTVDFPCEHATLTLFNRRNFQRKTCKMLAKSFVCNIFKDMNLLPFWPRRKPRGNNFLLKSAPVRERLSRITFKKIQTRYFFPPLFPLGRKFLAKDMSDLKYLYLNIFADSYMPSFTTSLLDQQFVLKRERKENYPGNELK